MISCILMKIKYEQFHLVFITAKYTIFIISNKSKSMFLNVLII